MEVTERKIIIKKKELEDIIQDKIVVVYQIVDNEELQNRMAIHSDYHTHEYEFYFSYVYNIIGRYREYLVEHGKVREIKRFP